jgi:prevent-host-death family protein
MDRGQRPVVGRPAGLRRVYWRGFGADPSRFGCPGLGAKCYTTTHMSRVVGVRELRQNLSRYLDRVRAGESLIVTDRGREVARLIPFASDGYSELARRFDATVPSGRLERAAERAGEPGLAAGTTDAFLAESRGERGAV